MRISGNEYLEYFRYWLPSPHFYVLCFSSLSFSTSWGCADGRQSWKAHLIVWVETCHNIAMLILQIFRNPLNTVNQYLVNNLQTKVKVNWLFNVTCNDISVINVTAHRYAGGLKKLALPSGSQCHRHFVGFCNVPVQTPTRDHPF